MPSSAIQESATNSFTTALRGVCVASMLSVVALGADGTLATADPPQTASKASASEQVFDHLAAATLSFAGALRTGELGVALPTPTETGSALSSADGATPSPSSQAASGSGCTMQLHAEGELYETAYGWELNGVQGPAYGSFAERYTGPTDICGVVLDLTSPNGGTGTADVYIWADGGGEPGAVLDVFVGFDPGEVPQWPEVTRYTVDLAASCAGHPVWVGYWGDWPGQTAPFFVAADLDGPAGDPMTNIAPGIGYPQGWNDVSAVWGATQSLGIGVLGLECGSLGACCLPDDSCQLETAPDCAGFGGEYQGAGTDCSASPCAPTGACCFQDICALAEQTACESGSGTFLGLGTVCDPDPCGPTPSGACCFGDVCVSLVPCVCADNGGTYGGDGIACDPNPCGASSGTEDPTESDRSRQLFDPQPNPSSGSARIDYRVTAEEHVELEVFDAQGRLITTLVDRVVSPGRHEVVWDGRDSQGRLVASGVYYSRLSAGDEEHQVKVLKLR